MKESFTSKTESPRLEVKEAGQKASERYKQIPAAKPRMFTTPETENGPNSESPFVFQPIEVQISRDTIENLIEANTFTEIELESFKLKVFLDELQVDDSIYGEYEITCCMRTNHDGNRVDKMVAELDTENPWQLGKIEHLLILAHMKPEHISGPVAALGTISKRSRNVSCIENKDGRVSYYNHPHGAGFNSNVLYIIFRRK